MAWIEKLMAWCNTFGSQYDPNVQNIKIKNHKFLHEFYEKLESRINRRMTNPSRNKKKSKTASFREAHCRHCNSL